MSTQCDKCDKPATVHLIEIRDGQKVEKHLCEEHALEEGVKVQVTNAPINELLKNFVVKHSGKEPAPTELRCEGCGLTWSEFRRAGLLGCSSHPPGQTLNAHTQHSETKCEAGHAQKS